MQSHQDSLSKEYDKNKIYCHKRRTSIGKSMPVTALLLNYPLPTKGYEKLGTDGLLPEEIERPPLYFEVNEIDEVDKEFKTTDNQIDETSFEIIDYNNKEINNENYNKKKSSSINNSILTADNNNIHSSSIQYTEINTNQNINQPLSLNKLCKKICNNDCNNITSNIQDMEDIRMNTKEEQTHTIPSKSLLKVPSKLDLERRKFLDKILKDVNLDEIVEIQSNSQSQFELNKQQFDLKNNNENSCIENKSDIQKKGLTEKCTIAQALARTTMMTSPAAKRRLAARKIEIELEFGGINSNDSNSDFVPPRDVLLYLVRMGSFTSAQKINNSDTQDDHLTIPNGLNYVDLIKYCKTIRGENHPQLLQRRFLNPTLNNANNYSNELPERFHSLNLTNSIGACSNTLNFPSNLIRVFQWNILSQSLGQKNDNFICCPDEALTWENRKFLIIEEILQNDPDIICLQEVDHFKFLERILGSLNYSGIFFPKPDSPCLYIEENNGPDGCAIFYKNNKFDMLNFYTRILEVWRVQSNQVAIILNLKLKDTNQELTVCTTHLKARNGTLLSKLRNEQGKDLLQFVNDVSGNRPILICGDFNAEPIEPVYSTVLNNRELELSSAYAEINKQIEDDNNFKINYIDNMNRNEEFRDKYNLAEIMAKSEPAYTTWKIREEGEVCHTIDYVFYSKNYFRVRNCLLFPESEEIGKNRTPSFRYPSDHFSLLCDFEILQNDSTISSIDGGGNNDSINNNI